MTIGYSSRVDPSSSKYLNLVAENLLLYPDRHPLRGRGAIGSGCLGLNPGSVSVKENMTSIQKVEKFMRFLLDSLICLPFGQSSIRAASLWRKLFRSQNVILERK